ncbi:MAG: sigma-70 family RNA polymerase sigma factor [Actinomycetota bacterium]|nr:sigma-70 family RNA polymerase sigma factor [Actinomycetota bacterium]
METGDTAELVGRAARGDRSAFDVLYRRHARSVAAAVASRISGNEDRADAVQETFLRAWKKLDTLRDPEQFLPWLYAIARNVATSAGRSKTRTAAGTLNDDISAAPEAMGPEELAELASLSAAAKGAMVVLSHRDATVITMATTFGFGPAEIAAALAITEGNAAVILHRARVRLRKELLARGVIDERGAPSDV